MHGTAPTVSLPRSGRDVDCWGIKLEDKRHCGCPIPLAKVIMEVGYRGWYCHFFRRSSSIIRYLL